MELEKGALDKVQEYIEYEVGEELADIINMLFAVAVELGVDVESE